MIPTKTYPLSAIMGNELTDKKRIAELTDAFNRVCAENADFVAESIKDETRIAELEAQVKHCEGHAAELEAEVMAWRERLGLAVAALESVAVDSQERFIRGVAKEALAQIEEGK
jgi:phage tail sheath gpL-like